MTSDESAFLRAVGNFTMHLWYLNILTVPNLTFLHFAVLKSLFCLFFFPPFVYCFLLLVFVQLVKCPLGWEYEKIMGSSLDRQINDQPTLLCAYFHKFSITLISDILYKCHIDTNYWLLGRNFSCSYSSSSNISISVSVETLTLNKRKDEMNSYKTFTIHVTCKKYYNNKFVLTNELYTLFHE